MHAWYRITMLLLCGFIAAALAELGPKLKRGPKMCEQLCNKRPDCNEYQFDASDLSCQLNKTAFDKSPGNGGYRFNITKNKLRLYAEDKLNCSKNSIIFRNKRNFSICRDYLSKQKKKLEGKRLLIFSKGENLEGRQVFLPNNTTIQNPYMKKGTVLGAVYVYSLKQLFISQTKCLRVVYVDTNKDAYNISDGRGLPIRGLAVDQRRLLVFMISSDRVIYSYDCSEHSFEHVHGNIFGAKQIAVDTKRKEIYTTATLKRLVKLTYDGEIIQMFSDEKFREPIHIDPENSFLYYVTERNRLKRMSLSSNQERKVLETHFKPTFLNIIDDKLYVSVCTKIYIFNNRGSTKQNPDNMAYIETKYKIHIKLGVSACPVLITCVLL